MERDAGAASSGDAGAVSSGDVGAVSSGGAGVVYSGEAVVVSSGDDDVVEHARKRARSAEERRAETSETDEDSGDQPGEVGGEDSEDSDVSEEEEEVESIVDHRKGRGTKYLLKWKGLPHSANTWEPAEDLDCDELIQAYWQRMNKDYTPSSAVDKTARGRGTVSNGNETKHSAEDRANATADQREQNPVATKKPIGVVKNASRHSGVQPEFLVPPYHQWEERVFRVASVAQENDGLVCEIEWYPGVCTVHPTSLIREHCPRKLLDFYELRLRFTNEND